ncbi:MAG: tetratricopeptide repeat protein [Desulfomonile tiedjei]|nr:tetratricopeptide repeat protein [Desulfomonile tiedjei]
MMWRYARTAGVIGSLLILLGCDPGALVKEKVPEPLKSALTFGSAGAGTGQAKPVVASIEIAVPKKDAAYSSGEPVAFKANVKTEGLDKAEQPGVTWTLFDGQGKPLGPVGQGVSVSKALSPGTYRVDASLQYGSETRQARVSFSVAPSVTGKVVSRAGTGIPGVDLKALDPETGSEIGSLKSRDDGTFVVTFSTSDYVVVTPHKAGLSFAPYRRYVKSSPPPTDLRFVGSEGEITDLQLVKKPNGTEQKTEVCPSDDALLTLKLQTANKPVSYEALLVRTGPKSEDLIRCERVAPASKGAEEPAAPESRTLKVTFPSPSDLNIAKGSFSLRLVVTDDKGNVLSAQAPGVYRVDMSRCFSQTMAEAKSLQEQKKFQDAVSAYNLAEQMAQIAAEDEEPASVMPKVQFDRGLAYLGMSKVAKRGTSEQRHDLGRARVDFSAVLKRGPKDPEALLFRGLIHFEAGDPEPALADYREVLLVAPRTPVAKLLRGCAYVKTGLKQNLSLAVDDFTEALTAEPEDTVLRKARFETLKAFVQAKGKKESEKVDTAEIHLPDPLDRMDLIKYIRE